MLAGRVAETRYQEHSVDVRRDALGVVKSGSHHMYRKQGVVEKINLQRDGEDAKPYQVNQVRRNILKYRLGGDH